MTKFIERKIFEILDNESNYFETYADAAEFAIRILKHNGFNIDDVDASEIHGLLFNYFDN